MTPPALITSAPVRALANRSIMCRTLVRPDSLAAERQAEQLETAIVEPMGLVLERQASVASLADSPQANWQPFKGLAKAQGCCAGGS